MPSQKLIFILILLLTALPVFAQSKKAAAEIRALEDRRVEAVLKRDVKTLGELFAADATYGHSTGAIETKEQFIKRLGPDGDLVYAAMDRREVKARVYKDSALVTGIVTIKVVVSGNTINVGDARFLAVWVKQKGKWKFAAWQSAKMQ